MEDYGLDGNIRMWRQNDKKIFICQNWKVEDNITWSHLDIESDLADANTPLKKVTQLLSLSTFSTHLHHPQFSLWGLPLSAVMDSKRLQELTLMRSSDLLSQGPFRVGCRAENSNDRPHEPPIREVDFFSTSRRSRNQLDNEDDDREIKKSNGRSISLSNPSLSDTHVRL